MSILNRTLIAFGLVLSIFLAQGIVTAIKLVSLANTAKVAMTNPITEVDAARSAWNFFRQAYDYSDGITQGIRYQDGDTAIAQFKTRSDTVMDELRRVESVSSSGRASALVREVSELVQRWRSNTLTLLGDRPATSIPAPFVIARLDREIRGRLNEIVTSAVTSAERTRAALQVEVEAMQWWAMCLLTVGMAIGMALAVVSALSITRPLARIESSMRRISEGQLDTRVTDHDRRDEIGSMARALEVFRSNAQEVDRLEAEKQEAERKAIADRKAELHKLADDFQAVFGQAVEIVSSASTRLEAAAGGLASTADTTQHLCATVAASAGEASSNVEMVAAASEQLGASVQEIARQVEESSEIAAQAVQQAGKTDTRIAELSQSAARIGDVVKLITDIADQTNLLALNATIEAARAGTAGKGFAVVAQEVKALASQTGKATEDIVRQISDIQRATQDSVGAIKEISSTITRIAQIATVVAATVDSQTAATRDIAYSVVHAARGTSHVATNIGEVSQGASETGAAAAQVLSSAQVLSVESGKLKSEVDKLLTTIRAA